MLPHASEVAPLSGFGPAATLTNQPALGMRSSPGPLLFGGSVSTVVLVAVPSGPAVTLFSVKAGGTKMLLKISPVVGAGAPQTPGRICMAWTLPGTRPDSLTLTVTAGFGLLPAPGSLRRARPRTPEPLAGASASRVFSGGLAPSAMW